jgi:UDP-N-acetylmuramoyl-tripeptide--D-alanyl-D-alanine ligase
MSDFVWTPDEVRAATGALLEGSAPPERFTRISTDTRTVKAGALFVALQGERFDAHDFLDQAAEAGAAGALVTHLPEGAPEGLAYFVVPHTLHALGRMGRHRRRRLKARVLCVTGTNGKTTTKDLLRTLLATRYRVHATEGNLNNQIGLPLTLLAAPDDCEVVVAEIGTNTPGEIGILAAIAEPELGVVTAVGEGHLELLGSVHGVLVEKTSLLAALPPGAPGFVAEEPAELPERARFLLGDERVRVAGYGDDADLRPDGGLEGVTVREDGTTEWEWRGMQVHLPLRGRHNVRNALLALGVAEEWGVEPAAAVEALRRLPPPKLRGEWMTVAGMRVIADCYNSNPSSLAAAVDLLATLPSEGEKVAVLGTMKEMGSDSARIHERSARQVAERVGAGVDRVVATGEFVAAFAELRGTLGDRLVVEEDVLDAYARVAPTLDAGDTLLLKGSRGVALERWIDRLREEREAPATVRGEG